MKTTSKMILVYLALCTILLVSCQNKSETGNEIDSAKEDPDVQSLPSKAECDPGSPSTEASKITGYFEEEIGGETIKYAILPNGNKITPVGELLDLRRFAWGIDISADGKRAYVINSQEGAYLQVIDIESKPPVLIESHATNNDHGIILSPDQSKLYISGGSSKLIHVFDIVGASSSKENELQALPDIKVGNWVGGLGISPDSEYLYFGSPNVGLLTKIKLADNEMTEMHVGYTPYDIVLSTDGSLAYVSNWAGGNVSVVNAETMTLVKKIKVDKNPEGLALAENGAYLIVTNSDADNISIIDTATNSVMDTLELDADNPELKSWSPNAIVVHPDSSAHRAYVVCADRNSIEVIDTENWQVLGSIPTAAYPVQIKMDSAGEKLVISNMKGWGSKKGESTHHHLFGVLQIVDTPASTIELEPLSRIVIENNSQPLKYFPDSNCDNKVPLPLNSEEKSVIEHVILVIKENKTYDEILGDLKGAEGDEWHAPAYAKDYGMNVILKGKAEEVKADVTPNAHSFANTFIDFVNYYADAEVSLQGHMWTTQADCNDYVEKMRDSLMPGTGIDPTTIHYNRSIFQHLENNNLNFRVYGEPVNFGPAELLKWREKIDLKYPYWTNGISDIDKANRIIKEWDLSVEKDNKDLFPSFIYIVLPNDHAQGGKADAPTVQSHVADNDAAMGMLADWLSHSPYWEKSIMFVIEDDPQSSVGDHIDAHRSVCFAVSPWIKRNYTSTVHYSIPSLYRTIELILGMPPINQNTLMSPPMIDIFSSEVNKTPYDAIPMQFEPYFNPSTGKFADEAKQWDWSTFDGHKGYGDHVWRLLHGDEKRPEGTKLIKD